jgi:histidyl-tRNA synthetase
MRINNRLVLNGLLEELGLADKAVPLLRVLDKLPKVGREAVVQEMSEKTGVTADQAGQVLSLAELRGSNREILDRLQTDFGRNAKATEGISRLRELLAVARTAGVPEERLRLDLSICRGLDYYTGTIYETFLLDKEDIGSVCSGGRYDNLAGLYTKQALPGVGASLGLDRLLAAMEEMGLLPQVSTPAPVLIVQFEAGRVGDYQRLARLLRAEGIGVEVYPDAKKLGQQFKYADSRGFRVALIAGPEELAQGAWKVKDLATKEERVVPEAEVVATIRAMVSR